MQEQENSQAETSLMHHRWKLFVYDGFVDVLVTCKELLNISEGDVCPYNGVPRNSWDLVERTLSCLHVPYDSIFAGVQEKTSVMLLQHIMSIDRHLCNAHSVIVIYFAPLTTQEDKNGSINGTLHYRC